MGCFVEDGRRAWAELRKAEDRPPLYICMNAAGFLRCTIIKGGLILRQDKPWAASKKHPKPVGVRSQVMWLVGWMFLRVADTEVAEEKLWRSGE